MKAIVQDEYGPPDVLELREIDRPQIGDREVLVRVKAAGTQAGDWHIMRGSPYIMRVMGFGLTRPKTRARGQDLAGVVEEVGTNVTELRPGDEVFGWGDGAFAEYAAIAAEALAPKPANLTFEQAAVVPSSAFTALQGVRDHGKVQPGQKVLVNGASGGVGTFAVQIAKAFEAEVTGVCSTGNVELVHSLGADQVIDYTQEDYTGGDERYDVIIDIAVKNSLAENRNILTPKGTYVLIGDSGGQWLGGLSRFITSQLMSPVVSQQLRPFVAKPNRPDLVFLKDLIEAGKLTPVIDRTYPLSETADAIRYLEEGHARGKIAITV